jgi:hypothetical protein
MGTVVRGYDLTGQGYAADRSPRGKIDKTRCVHTVEDIICYSRHKNFSIVIVFQPPRDHLSSSGAQCNCSILNYKRNEQTPILEKNSAKDYFRQVYLTA